MLVAIDGTSSRTASRSHTRSFCSRYRGSQFYQHGPDFWITGADLWDAVRTALRFVEWNLRSLGAQEPIDLVGHSRGGMGVIILAQRLHDRPAGPLAVRFLGLFDAVDRTPTLEFGRIPGNVKHARHAVRSAAAGSRWYFGNTGVSCAPTVNYRSTQIFGTHAAVGGDPWGGDHPGSLDAGADQLASVESFAWICREAQSVGVPVC